MIHGVSVMLWDYMNMQDMKQLMKGMDASERAVAEIYNSKTGIEVDTSPQHDDQGDVVHRPRSSGEGLR